MQSHALISFEKFKQLTTDEERIKFINTLDEKNLIDFVLLEDIKAPFLKEPATKFSSVFVWIASTFGVSRNSFKVVETILNQLPNKSGLFGQIAFKKLRPEAAFSNLFDMFIHSYYWNVRPRNPELIKKFIFLLGDNTISTLILNSTTSIVELKVLIGTKNFTKELLHFIINKINVKEFNHRYQQVDKFKGSQIGWTDGVFVFDFLVHAIRSLDFEAFKILFDKLSPFYGVLFFESLTLYTALYNDKKFELKFRDKFDPFLKEFKAFINDPTSKYSHLESFTDVAKEHSKVEDKQEWFEFLEKLLKNKSLSVKAKDSFLITYARLGIDLFNDKKHRNPKFFIKAYQAILQVSPNIDILDKSDNEFIARSLLEITGNVVRSKENLSANLFHSQVSLILGSARNCHALFMLALEHAISFLQKSTLPIKNVKVINSDVKDVKTPATASLAPIASEDIPDSDFITLLKANVLPENEVIQENSQIAIHLNKIILDLTERSNNLDKLGWKTISEKIKPEINMKSNSSDEKFLLSFIKKKILFECAEWRSKQQKIILLEMINILQHRKTTVWFFSNMDKDWCDGMVANLQKISDLLCHSSNSLKIN